MNASPRCRICTAEDIPWLVELAIFAFGPEEVTDPNGSKLWLLSVIDNPDILIIRTEHSALIGITERRFHAPNKVRAWAEFFASFRPSPFDTLILLREAADWALSRGAKSLRFQPTTGVDISPLAKRLHAHVDYPCYIMDLEPCAVAAES